MKHAALVVPAVVAVAARLLTGPHPVDDAYITFRYARNLADGLGLVYNPGEWVLGTTAPAWALLLGLGTRLGYADVPSLACLVAAVCDAASAALLACFSLRLGWSGPVRWCAALVGLAWALNPMSIAYAVGGMETSLFVLVCLAALGLAASGRWMPAAALAGLGSFVRPESLLLGVAIVGWTSAARRQRLPRTALAAGVPVVLGGLLLFLGYGSPLPNSLAAKRVAYHAAWPFENLVALVLQAGLPGWSTYLLAVVPNAVGLALAAVGLVSLLVLARLGLAWVDRRGLVWQPFASFAALYLGFYVEVGLQGVRLFPWYLVPLVPAYLLLTAAGLARLTSLAAPRQGCRPRWTGLARAASLRLAISCRLAGVAPAGLAALLVAWQLPALDWQHPLLPAGISFWRERVLFDVGRDLGHMLPPNAVVAAPEIGALGYASNLRILDTVGLVSPAALPYYPLPEDQLVADNAIPPRLIDDQLPDVVVTLDAFARRSLVPDPTFQRTYRLEGRYPAPVWASQELLLFRRVEPGAGF